ncbi:response regulator transcription factor [Nonomuraea sp. M3C6]|uniref:Response regulator transcription factor n=1 Tax=Nonomuraea marmarensis TaxID=3351344 RepID=A0ABW7A9X5_9ACTN
MAEGSPIKVLLADDHPVVREGLIAMLESADGITVVGEAGSGEEAVVQAGALRPDIILLDLRMGAMDGVSATEHILRQVPGSKVVIVTTCVTCSAWSAAA